MVTCGFCREVVTSVTRKKTLAPDLMTTELNRCLGISDLILMGIGYMVGAGIFMVTGEVVRHTAGASTILSYIISGAAATLSAICYAEFAAVVPLAGSAYTYTYIVCGELWAFFVGWNVILEYVLGTATAAKSWSGALDAIFNNSISNGIENSVGSFDNKWLSGYPDFISVGVVCVVTIFVAVGVQTSTNFNKVMVFFKLVTVTVILVAGFMLADVSNWVDPAKGGFMPYGFSGTLTGAATCFYAFVGFDGIAIASEETINPKKMVPIAIVASMVIVTLLYVITTMVLTLLVPYYDVDPLSPYPEAFKERGESWAIYVVGVGTLFGLATVILSGLYAVPRIMYAMAKDGLLFRPLGYIQPQTQTPLVPIILIGIASSILALVLDLDMLVSLLSIGTLFSYTFVAISIILIRYDETIIGSAANDAMASDRYEEDIPLQQNGSSAVSYDRELASSSEKINKEKDSEQKQPLAEKYKAFVSKYNKPKLVLNLLSVMILNIIVFCLVLWFGFDYVTSKSWSVLLVLAIAAVGIVLPLAVIGSLEQVPKRDSFQVPLVPYIPALSIFCNIGLMLVLGWPTWLRLLIWLALGSVMYFSYGMRHSNQRTRNVSYTDLDKYST